jgi:hypothetical protein
MAQTQLNDPLICVVKISLDLLNPQGRIAMTCIAMHRKLEDAYGILIWSFATMMHPESILESPVEVACFEFSRCRPGLVAGGCCTGQVIVWDYGKVQSLGCRALATTRAWHRSLVFCICLAKCQLRLDRPQDCPCRCMWSRLRQASRF